MVQSRHGQHKVLCGGAAAGLQPNLKARTLRSPWRVNSLSREQALHPATVGRQQPLRRSSQTNRPLTTCKISAPGQQQGSKGAEGTKNANLQHTEGCGSSSMSTMSSKVQKTNELAAKVLDTASRIKRLGGMENIVIPSKALPFLEHNPVWDGLHKPVGLIFASAYVLGTACQLSGVVPPYVWLPTLTGGVLGGLYAALNRAGMIRFWRAPTTPLNIVITGGTKGIGKAMAREFLRAGDRVFLTSRTPADVRRVMADLREEVSPDILVAGTHCDVSSPASVARLKDMAKSHMGTIDVWINNAGYSGSFQGFLDMEAGQMQQVVATNLVGSLLCTKAALQVMGGQATGGHIFNMDGAGADGLPTPQYAAYGATKAGIAHLMRSVQPEALEGESPVGVHTLSPGMVLTNLLLEGATPQSKQIFNILCEQPETVAAFLVPRVRTVVARSQTSRYIKYLTLPRALQRFLSAPLHAERFFDSQGAAVYLPERERILGQKARRTQRLAERAARRSRELALAYSLSIAASYLLFVVNSPPLLPS